MNFGSSSATCPHCNSEAQVRGRIYLNIDEEDVEYFLVNNPRIFADLVNRHQNILHPEEARRQNPTLLQCANDMRETINTMEHVIQQFADHAPPNRRNNDNNYNSDYFELPRLGLNMRVDQRGMLFSLLPPDSDIEDNNNNNEDDNNNHEDVFEIPTLGLSMNVNARAMTFARIPPSDDEDDEDD